MGGGGGARVRTFVSNTPVSRGPRPPPFAPTPPHPPPPSPVHRPKTSSSAPVGLLCFGGWAHPTATPGGRWPVDAPPYPVSTCWWTAATARGLALLRPDVAATREVAAVQVVSVQVVSVSPVPLQAAPVREEVRRALCGLVNAACSTPRFAPVSCRRFSLLVAAPA
jgi:hypothetical protein